MSYFLAPRESTAKTTPLLSDGVMLSKPPRRVLPEHEGRYKITLPSGTTPRSKEILAKKAHREFVFVIHIPLVVKIKLLHYQCIRTKRRKKESLIVWNWRLTEIICMKLLI